MKIGELIKAWRWREEISIREAAEQIGISHATLSRIERGHPMTGEHLAILLRWALG